ncbi:MAG TPA: hypothetical protein VHB21_26220 [Minicystis sp.]|nr:hypothetical protein [Minicystis sp.]
MKLVIVFVALFGGWFLWGRWLFWRAARQARAERERLAGLPAAKLADEVRRRIHFERWERFHSAKHILTRDDWTDSSLLESLNDLYAEAAREQPGNFGRDGNVFEFHDCGLASIVEILRARTR